MNAWITLRSIPTIIGLLVRTPYWAFNYSRNYKRAKRDFRKQLIEQGVPEDDAKQLAELFPFKIRDILTTVRSFN